VLISHTPSVAAPNVSSPPIITGPLEAMVVTDSQGAFSISGIPPGTYIACAEVSTPGLLDPCHWATSAPGVTVSAGQTVTGVTVTMARGAVLNVHIDDPQALLKPVPASQTDFDLQIHVITRKGIHYSSPVQTSNGAGRDHAVTIPFGTPVTLSVVSPHLVVNDQNGKPVSSAGTSIAASEGSTPSTVNYTVTGRK